MKAISSQRKLIVVILLGLAVVGASLRQWSANPSLTRDIGTLLLVAWLPAIGSVVAFFQGKLRRRPPAHATSPQPVQPKPRARSLPSFEPTRPFTGHLLVQLSPQMGAACATTMATAADTTAMAAATAAAALAPEQCVLMLGSEGFSARLPRPLAQCLAADPAQAVEIEFLRPGLALPRFFAGIAFQVLAGDCMVASGRVVKVLSQAHP